MFQVVYANGKNLTSQTVSLNEDLCRPRWLRRNFQHCCQMDFHILFFPSVFFPIVFSLSAPGVRGGRARCSSAELRSRTRVDFRRSQTEPLFSSLCSWNLGLCFQTTGAFLIDKYENITYVKFLRVCKKQEHYSVVWFLILSLL